MRISEAKLNKIEKKKEKINEKSYKIARRIQIKHLINICNSNDIINHIISLMGITAFYAVVDGDPLWGWQEEKLIGYKNYKKFMDRWNPIYSLDSNWLEIKDGKVIRDE